ncbi:MAG TPA: AMP-binding protein [Gaiellaceae bacterium]|nr:AMP-binding protein [Gaiellaceae bacterium]
MNENLACILSEPSHDPAAAALIDADGSISYSELRDRTLSAAARLVEAGVAPGDRVAIALPNAPSFAAAYFGALWIGAIAVPINILLRVREIEERLDAVSPAAVVYDGERETLLGPTAAARRLPGVTLDCEQGGAAVPMVRREGRDAAVILFTSGTSGVSKGAVLTHGSIAASARNAADALGFGPDDVVLGAAPFSHVLGQSTGLVATLLTGGAVSIVPRFEPADALARMTETRTTVLLGVPTMCIALCEAARGVAKLPPLRLAHVGGAPVPVEVARGFEETFGAAVYEGYGLTEISGIATTYREGQLRKPGSVGLPLGDTALRIVSPDGASVAVDEVGEVQFRGASVIPGYWLGAGREPAPVSADGWLPSGDLGYVDADGYLFLVDRLKELIIRNGYNVYPREVEEVLYAHPDVLEAVVIGIPDAKLGEEVVALVRPRPGSSCDSDAVREWARERVAAYKYPRHVVLVEALPTGPTGKILKREIDREALARRLSLS